MMNTEVDFKGREVRRTQCDQVNTGFAPRSDREGCDALAIHLVPLQCSHLYQLGVSIVPPPQKIEVKGTGRWWEAEPHRSPQTGF